MKKCILLGLIATLVTLTPSMHAYDSYKHMATPISKAVGWSVASSVYALAAGATFYFASQESGGTQKFLSVSAAIIGASAIVAFKYACKSWQVLFNRDKAIALSEVSDTAQNKTSDLSDSESNDSMEESEDYCFYNINCKKYPECRKDVESKRVVECKDCKALSLTYSVRKSIKSLHVQ